MTDDRTLWARRPRPAVLIGLEDEIVKTVQVKWPFPTRIYVPLRRRNGTPGESVFELVAEHGDALEYRRPKTTPPAQGAKS